MNHNLKRNFVGIFLIIFSLTLLSTGCDKEDEEKIVVMNVSPELVWIGVRPPGHYTDSVEVMECVIEDTNEILYLHQNAIEGFEYIAGFQYKIRVKIINLENPPADGYTQRYELLEIISKDKKHKFNS